MAETEDDKRPEVLRGLLSLLGGLAKLLLYGVIWYFGMSYSWRAGVLAGAMYGSGLSLEWADAWAWLKYGPAAGGQTFLAILTASVLAAVLMPAALFGPRALFNTLQDFVAQRPLVSMFCAMILLGVVVFAPVFGLALGAGLVLLLAVGPLLLRLIRLFESPIWLGFVTLIYVLVVIAVAGFIIGAASPREADKVTCRAGETVALKSGETISCVQAIAQYWPWMFLETETRLRVLKGSDLEKTPVVIRFYNREFDN